MRIIIKNISFLCLFILVTYICCRKNLVKNSPSQSQGMDNITGAAGTYKDTAVTNFFRRETGLIAADGGFSIPLSNGRVLWMMDDSHINDYRAADGTMGWLFQVRNAALLQPINDWKWQNTATLTGNSRVTPSYIKFTENNSEWIWPNSGFQLGDTLYVYSANITNKRGGLGFGPAGNDFLAKIKVPEMTVAGYVRLQDFNGINFGITFLKNVDGYMYVYGNRSAGMASELFLARFPANHIAAKWAFYDGAGWSAEVTKAKSIGRGQSNGVSINRVNGKFLIVSTEFSVGCNQGNRIFLSTGDSPTGPFTPAKAIYKITDTVQNNYPFIYAAIIHPEYTNSKGEVLVTYAVNNYPGCLPDHDANYRSIPDRYRLRGIRIPWSVVMAK
ncbi:MAG TPA: DUF4185 domain-containing protein [Mucilaginibacter sp.]|jgi:hypothetical protein|nr:DUF4185 domain-containing protein [Mucilaginibacter sp.]